MKKEIDSTPVEFVPIGFVRTSAVDIPKHWTISNVRGELVMDERLVKGLADIAVGSELVVLFHFHKSPPFTRDLLKQTPPTRDRPRGVFSTCSPVRPNAIGLSILEVLAIKKNVIEVNRIDMLDGTPILDLKPHKK